MQVTIDKEGTLYRVEGKCKRALYCPLTSMTHYCGTACALLEIDRCNTVHTVTLRCAASDVCYELKKTNL